jgi:hypothetical protein
MKLPHHTVVAAACNSRGQHNAVLSIVDILRTNCCRANISEIETWDEQVKLAWLKGLRV